MSEEVKNIETKAETVNINIDELFNGAPSAEGITLPQEEPSKPSIFQKKDDVDMSFTEPKETVEEAVEFWNLGQKRIPGFKVGENG